MQVLNWMYCMLDMRPQQLLDKVNIIQFVIGLSLLISVTVSGVMMQIALKHNPSGEYCEYLEEDASNRHCQINWNHWLMLGIIWFSFTFLIISVLCKIIIFIYQFFTYFIKII